MKHNKLKVIDLEKHLLQLESEGKDTSELRAFLTSLLLTQTAPESS
ncbi:hypothetical protein J23TS9_06330 [Paenibacillus sp. J23TS9]|nr:hypothetical protein J23TS9_06330 [Paenibacillus sp. J23TS9]